MKVQKSILSAFILSCGLASTSAAANERPELFAGMFDVDKHLIFGFALGGDKVGELRYNDGSSTDVSSGAGFSMGGGLDLQHFEKPYGIELSFVYKFDSAVAENADVTFDRFELSAIPYYKLNEKARLGIGFSQHFGVEFAAEMDGYGSSSVEFDSGTALVAQLTFDHTDVLNWGFKATNITYTSETVEDISGTNIGVFMNYSF